MKQIKFNQHIVVAVFCAFMLWTQSCSKLPVISGSATEDGNVVGKILDSAGIAQSHVKVMLFPVLYDPLAQGTLPDSLVDTTDNDGAYVFKKIKKGYYNLYAIHLEKRTRTMVPQVLITGETQTLSSGIVQKTGSIKVMLIAPVDTLFGYLFLPGTPNSVTLHSGGWALLDSIPSGSISALCYAVQNSPVVPMAINKQNIDVAPAATTLIAYSPVQYSKKLFLNTTASGANVMGMVLNFPVLVRLTAGNFNFSQTLESGADLRFTKADGSPLSYELSQWDAAQNLAEVWVKVDTVFGNNSSQYIMMYWGAQAVSATTSSGAAVFDTAKGFAGVWHLNGNCNDATANQNNGYNQGATDTSGIIGNAKRFNAKDSIVIPGLMHSLQTVSLSAWVNIDSGNGSYGGDVVSIGDAVLIRVDEKSNGVMGGFHVVDTVFRVVGSGQFYAKTGWHYVTFTYDGKTHVQTLFIDDSVSKTQAFTDPINYSGVGKNTIFGAHGNGKSLNFKGAIDEVRVSSSIATPDWVRLCFMNQRADDRLIIFSAGN